MQKFISPTLALGVALIVGLSGSAALAQDPSQPAASTAQTPSSQMPHTSHVPNPQHQAKMMAKKLGLTPGQESKLDPILADRDQQLQSAHADTTLAPRDKHARIRAINQESDSKIKALLNDMQKQQYEQMKVSHKASKQQQQGAPPSNS